jgi:hypothetical protein
VLRLARVSVVLSSAGMSAKAEEWRLLKQAAVRTDR